MTSPCDQCPKREGVLAAAVGPVRRAAAMLADAGISRQARKLRCYVLVGHDGDTVEDARDRLEASWDMGAIPFAMPYQPSEGRIVRGREWRALIREWSRPAAMFAAHKAVTGA